MFDATRRDGVTQLHRPGTRWLSTGFDGGLRTSDAAYNVTVPDGWPETDLATYAAERRDQAGFAAPGPTLLTGVDQAHARRARLDPVEVVATAGLSNPAALPMPWDEGDGGKTETQQTGSHLGTVNIIVGTTRALAPGALANLATVAAEAKAATLQARTGIPGTTTDAIIVGSDPDGDEATFSGSATDVGRAARACVRDAVLACLASRYPDGDVPASVAAAEHGVVTDEKADVTEV